MSTTTVGLVCLALILFVCAAGVAYEAFFIHVARAEYVRYVLTAILALAATAVATAVVVRKASPFYWYFVTALLAFAASIFWLGTRLTVEYLFPLSLLFAFRRAMSLLTFGLLVPAAVVLYLWDGPLADEIWYGLVVVVVLADLRLTARRRRKRASTRPAASAPPCSPTPPASSSPG